MIKTTSHLQLSEQSAHARAEFIIWVIENVTLLLILVYLITFCTHLFGDRIELEWQGC